MADSLPLFALCIDPSGAGDLGKGKVYQVLPDSTAEQEGMLRVIDESAEDYRYPSAFFVALDLPQKARDALAVRT
jgi:molybdopterin-guanine dinucleotide biosynthesis protein A